MILPILISVSLAPGSYFFCAGAAAAVPAATASAASVNRLRIRAGMVLSRLATCFDQVSQVRRARASIGLFACDDWESRPLRSGVAGARCDLDHFPLVLIGRIGLRPVVRLHRGAAH